MMNIIKNNIIDEYGKNPQTFEGSFFAQELIMSSKVGEKSKEGEIYTTNQSQNAAKADVHHGVKKKDMHDSLSCAACNSYIITRKVTSNLGIIWSKSGAADFVGERMMNEKEIHDLWCSSCNSYMNKRVITLHGKDISPDQQPEQVILPMPPSHEEPHLELVKAIVYGGLLQSITSLGVVVSAAGGDVSTLNIIALGLASVFGGLLILVDNLKSMKQDQNTEYYEQELGRQEHLIFHSTMAIISYLIFGITCPIIYGFSFYKSDNKYLKLTTLAAVSLVCITLLSMGKAYTQRPPKPYMKTIFSYIGLGVMVAGPGYIAAHLANMLLKKLGMFDSLSSHSVNWVEGEVVKLAWSSY